MHTFRRLLCGAFVSADLQSVAVKYKGLCPDKKVPICIPQRKDELATDTAEEVFFGLEILIFGLGGFQIRPNEADDFFRPLMISNPSERVEIQRRPAAMPVPDCHSSTEFSVRKKGFLLFPCFNDRADCRKQEPDC